MFKKIALGVLVVVAVLLVVIATRPADFRIARSETVAAPAEVVYAYLNDFRMWGTWSPYEKLDPEMRRTYEGEPSGAGAIYHYVSEKVGEGRMTVTESRPHERIAIEAEFIKPMAHTNVVEFTLTPVAEGVSVTWAMSGRNNFVGKAFSLFVDVDELVGTDFEAGLAQLKRVSEEEGRRGAETVEASEPATSATRPVGM